MQKLDPRAISALTILNRYSAYLLARLQADPGLTSLAEVIQKRHAALFSSIFGLWSAQRERAAALAVRDEMTYQLDVALRSLRTAVLAFTHNDRHSKMYTALFPKGFSDVLERNPSHKLILARKMLQELAAFDHPVSAQAVEELRAAVDGLGGAMDALEGAKRAEQAAVSTLETAKRSYCTHYEETYHKLVLALGDRPRADGFFHRTRLRRSEVVSER